MLLNASLFCVGDSFSPLLWNKKRYLFKYMDICFVSPAVCRLPMAAQPCTGQPLVWAFDSTVGLCVPYKQGFCQGNANKFYRKAECDEYCGVLNDGEFMKEIYNPQNKHTTPRPPPAHDNNMCIFNHFQRENSWRQTEWAEETLKPSWTYHTARQLEAASQKPHVRTGFCLSTYRICDVISHQIANKTLNSVWLVFLVC